MAEKYPKDRFDSIPDDLRRVGAHRAPRAKGRGWIGFGWAALATVVLIGLGVFTLSLVNGSISFKGGIGGASVSPSVSSTPTPTIVPTVNPALTVNVLNGTSTANLAGKVGDILTAAGWKVGARANADATNLTQTIVYYSDAKNQAAALGVAQSLPGATVALTQDYAATGADLTVVVGSDFTG
ncbi:LytR C-terminal domain-containing protein [Leifsonia poae]|uniref:LytR C-terminal domain-containing protein n=1 Tax=Leifsonia poae TaxID=110933 RepID=UPI001CBF445D|nr:LytR C-terminal domain-containing protein [Leifsonia poae]